MNSKYAPIILTLVFSLFVGCDDLWEDDDEGHNETKISANGDDESHHTGDNCMQCHKEGGEGEGWFTVAGTVYYADLITPYPNAVVYLGQGPMSSGPWLMSIEVDSKGNFYTTEDIDWVAVGLISIADDTLASASMWYPTNGACNSCHDGSTVDVIYIE
jgi:hypothetical protein